MKKNTEYVQMRFQCFFIAMPNELEIFPIKYILFYYYAVIAWNIMKFIKMYWNI